MTFILIKTTRHTCFTLPKSPKRRIDSSIEDTGIILHFVLILLPFPQTHELYVDFVFSSNNSSGRIFLPGESLVHQCLQSDAASAQKTSLCLFNLCLNNAAAEAYICRYESIVMSDQMTDSSDNSLNLTPGIVLLRCYNIFMED